MKGHGHIKKVKFNPDFSMTLYGKNQKGLNFDVESYQFDSPELEEAVMRLSRRDREILLLYLMGHTHKDIGKGFDATRSMISKRLILIEKRLGYLLK